MFRTYLAVWVFIIGFFLGNIYTRARMHIREKRQKKYMLLVKRKKSAVEEKRIADLPKLNTEYLMRIPDEFPRLMKSGPDCKPEVECYRTFGRYYSYLVIYDERGQGWIGLIMDETLRSLRDGEYTCRDYHVPIKGPGEAHHAPSVIVNGPTINTYPRWMEDGRNIVEWNSWLLLYRLFKESGKARSTQEIFEYFLPEDTLREAARKREEYLMLRRECNLA